MQTYAFLIQSWIDKFEDIWTLYMYFAILAIDKRVYQHQFQSIFLNGEPPDELSHLRSVQSTLIVSEVNSVLYDPRTMQLPVPSIFLLNESVKHLILESKINLRISIRLLFVKMCYCHYILNYISILDTYQRLPSL